MYMADFEPLTGLIGFNNNISILVDTWEKNCDYQPSTNLYHICVYQRNINITACYDATNIYKELKNQRGSLAHPISGSLAGDWTMCDKD